MADRRDFYEVLGVPRTADAKEIQRAYRKLARENHPDVNKAPGAEERFKEISEAYDVLSDPDTRSRYDRFGPDFRQVPEGVDPAQWAAAQRRARAGAGRPGAGGGRVSGDDSDFFVGDLGDLDLDDMLGGLFGRAGGPFGGRRSRGPLRGADQEAEMELSVEDAYAGGRRHITLTSASGAERSYDVNIPPGVVDGQRIRLAGQGGQGSDGGSPGDLYLVVRIRPDGRFRLEGRDVHVDLPVTPWEAALGATVPVEGPGGPAKVKVPPGTSSGRRLRLRKRGLPNPNGDPGDLYAEVRIMVPSRLNSREKGLFEELARASDFDPRRQA
ncbi:MAG TPA: DnaJ C-terminal domain-containing protein [Acidimicrobiales bacterium]|nr:DnaJ C-terminal domain-containing protein [Acidimicrobiales bacterium]